MDFHPLEFIDICKESEGMQNAFNSKYSSTNDDPQA